MHKEDSKKKNQQIATSIRLKELNKRLQLLFMTGEIETEFLVPLDQKGLVRMIAFPQKLQKPMFRNKGIVNTQGFTLGTKVKLKKTCLNNM